jgi:hypothetical protein
MIDPLFNIGMPQPGASAAAQETAPGTPSFLPWMQSEQDDVGANAGNSDPGAASADCLVDPAAVDPFVLDPRGAHPRLADPSVLLQSPATQAASPTLPAAGQPELLSDSTRLILDATRWRDFVSAMLELHVRNPQGEREVVAMPWRLMASGHLAHVNAMSGMPGQAAVLGGAHPVAGAQAAATAAAPASISMSSGSSLPIFDGRGIPVEAMLSQSATRSRDDVATLKTMSSHAPAAAEWLARWMKWIEREGHDAVVWLRDFSIDEDQAARVVEGLRGFALAQGVGLERIVVNGRELWRNPQLTAFSEHRE